MIVDVLVYLAGAAALVAAGSRIWATRGFARRGELWVLCIGGGIVALAALLLAPTSAQLLSQAQDETGVNLGKLFGDALRLAGAGAAGLLATYIRDDRRPSSGAWLRGLAVVEVALAGTFFAADFDTVGNGQFIEVHRTVPGVAYDSIRLLYPIVSLGLFLLAIWPYARGLPHGPARVGSQLLAAASVIGIAWTSWTVDDIVTLAGSGRQNTGDDLVSAVLEIAFVAFVAAGTTVTIWGDLVQRTTTWLRAVRSYRAMAPLWRALCAPDGGRGAAAPGSQLPAGLAARLSVQPWRASIARYRRVIEIRDAQLALRPYQPRDGGSGERLPVTEAREIVAGLAAFKAGQVADSTHAAGGSNGQAQPEPSVDTSMQHSIEAEAQWLAEVSRALVHVRSERSGPSAPASPTVHTGR